MAITAADLQVNFSTKNADKVKRDISGIGDAVDSAASRSRTFASTLFGVAGGVLSAQLLTQAFTGIKNVMSDVVWGASNLAEAQSKVNVVFGDSAGEVTAWADAAANSFGLSKQQALDTAGAMGNLFINMGFTNDAAADMSTSLLGLTADMSSFFNVSSPEIIDAMTSAFVGEYDALQRLGVNINAAQVEQYALNNGIWDGTAALTDQQRALAVQGILWDQTAAAQGDFARTSDGLANQSRILRANMANLSAEIGARLLPVAISLTSWGVGAIQMFQRIADSPKPFEAAMSELHNVLFKAFGRKTATLIMGVVRDMVEGFQDLVDIAKDVTDAIADFSGDVFENTFGFLVDNGDTVTMVLKGIALGLGVVAAASLVAAAATGVLAGIMAVLFSPITLIVAAIAALYVAYQTNFLGFADGVRAAVDAIMPGIEALIGFIQRLRDAFSAGGWTAVWDELRNSAVQAFTAIMAAASLAIDAITSRWPALGPIFEAVAASVQWVVDTITTLVGMAIDFATQESTINAFKAVWDGLTTAVGAVIGIISTVAGYVFDFATSESAINAYKLVWDGLTSAIGAVVGIISTVAGYVFDFATAESTITTFQAVWDGLTTAIDAVVGAIDAVMGYAIDFATAETTVNAFKQVWSNLSGAVTQVVTSISTVATYVFDFATAEATVNAFKVVWDNLSAAVGAVIGIIATVAGYVFDFVTAETTVNAFKTVWNGLQSAIDAITGAIDTVAALTPDFSSIISAVNTILTPIQAVIDAWNAMTGLFGGGGSDTPASAGGMGDPTNPGGPGGIPFPGGGGGGGGWELDIANQNALDFGKRINLGPLRELRAEITGLRDDLNGSVGPALEAFGAKLTTSLANGASVATTAYSSLMALLGPATQKPMLAAQMAVTSGMATITAGLVNGAATSSSAYASLMALIAPATQKPLNVAQNAVINAMANIVATVANSLSTVVSVTTSLMSSARSAVVSAMASIVSAGNSGMASYRNAISSGMSSAVAAVRSGVSAMVAAASGGRGQMSSAGVGIGAALGQGIAAGIRGMIGSVASAAASLVSSAIAAARSAGGIASPSRIMRLQVGRPLGLGAVLGVEDLFPRMDAAMGRLVSIPSIDPYGGRLAVNSAYGGSFATAPVAPAQPIVIVTLASEEWVEVAQAARTAPERTLAVMAKAESLTVVKGGL